MDGTLWRYVCSDFVLAGLTHSQDTRSLDSFNWYEGLYAYSRPSPDDSEELGPDGDLVTSMITTAIIPWLAKVVGSGALDPYSAGHIKRAIELIEELEVSVEKDNPKMQVSNPCLNDRFPGYINSIPAPVQSCHRLV